MNNSTRVKVYRVILILSTVLILLFSSVLPSFAVIPPFVDYGDVYTSLPEPVPDDFNKYCVIQTVEGFFYLAHIYSTTPFNLVSTDTSQFISGYPHVTISYTEDSGYIIEADKGGSQHNSCIITCDLYFGTDYKGHFCGEFGSRKSVILTDSSPRGWLSSWGAGFSVSFLPYGILPKTINDNYSLSKVHWADSVNPDTYLSWLSKIDSNLHEIDMNTAAAVSGLSYIKTEIGLFRSLFDKYQNKILSDVDIIKSRLQNIENHLSSIDNSVSNIWEDISRKNEEQSRFYEQNIGGFGNNPDDVNNNILNGYVQPGDQGGGSFGGFEGGQQGFNDGLNFIDNFGDPGSQSLMLSTFRIGSLFIAPMLPLIVGFAVVFILLHKAGE